MRQCVLSNGCLYLGFDQWCTLREMFWPVVGLANHMAEDRRNNLVLWNHGQFFDLRGDNWHFKREYGDGMSFSWHFEDSNKGLTGLITDVLDPYDPIWSRTVKLKSSQVNSQAVYFCHSFNLNENNVGEHVFYDFHKKRLYHHKNYTWIAVHVCGEDTGEINTAVAKRSEGGVGFDYEGGGIHGPLVEHGSVESMIGLHWRNKVSFEYSLVAGKDQKEADALMDKAVRMGHGGIRNRSAKYWFLKKKPIPEKETGMEKNLELCNTSLKVIASHFDRGGAVLASCDMDIMGDYRDHYRYVWHRDAAMIASTVLRCGFPQLTKRYLMFCEKTLSEEGFFWQRYKPDGTRGSGWHPVQPHAGELPIQEDETALALITAAQYMDSTGDLDFIARIYPTFIKPAATFISRYTQKSGTLVKPSFDLWEERRGVFCFTQACCIAGLYGAYRIARVLSEENSGFAQAMDRLARGIVERMIDDEIGLCRGLIPQGMGYGQDKTGDASLFLVKLVLDDVSFPGYGEYLRSIDRACKKTWMRLEKVLNVEVNGFKAMARYPGDWYWRPENANHIPGNPWIVTTAWYLLSGISMDFLTVQDLRKYLSLFCRMTLDSGIMPEQVHGIKGEPISVCPLPWSHASFLDVANRIGLM